MADVALWIERGNENQKNKQTKLKQDDFLKFEHSQNENVLPDTYQDKWFQQASNNRSACCNICHQHGKANILCL